MEKWSRALSRTAPNGIVLYIYLWSTSCAENDESIYVCVCVYTKSAKRLADLFDVWGGRETAMFHDRSSLKSPLTHRQAYVRSQCDHLGTSVLGNGEEFQLFANPKCFRESPEMQ